jgi:nucleoside-diphosphate-sugar epimerase
VLHGFGRLHGVETVELRLFTPFGPWERPTRLVAQTILCALSGRDVPVGQPDVVRDWVFVTDVVDALVRSAGADLPSEAKLNVASGIGVRVIDMVEAILAEMDTRSVARVDPAARRAHDIPALSGHPGLADGVLGWRATTPLSEGIRRTIDWFRGNRILAEALR